MKIYLSSSTFSFRFSRWKKTLASTTRTFSLVYNVTWHTKQVSHSEANQDKFQFFVVDKNSLFGHFMTMWLS